MGVSPQKGPAGSWLANAAPVTPGVCRSASINRACSARRRSAAFLGCAGASRQGEVERDEAVGVEAQRHAFEIAHVNDENGRRRQEREGERDFGDDERLRQALRRRGG